MTKLSQLRIRAEELRINNHPRMRKSELETEIHKKEQTITAEGTPQSTVRQSANK
jgi:hypothetical protein